MHPGKDGSDVVFLNRTVHFGNHQNSGSFWQRSCLFCFLMYMMASARMMMTMRFPGGMMLFTLMVAISMVAGMKGTFLTMAMRAYDMATATGNR